MRLIRAWVRHLVSHSIWAPGAIPAEEWKYRNLKRIALPIYDAVLVFAGIAAARHGIPAIDRFFPPVIADVFALSFAVTAFACLVGVAFPELWPFETVAKGVLIGMLTTYVAALFILLTSDDGNRWFLTLITVAAMVLPVWRITLIGNERAVRKLKEEAAAKLRAAEQAGE